jgi:hypothetical protein
MIAVTTVFVAGCSTGQGDPKVAAAVGTTNVSTVEQVQQRLNDLLARNPQAQEVAKQHKLDQVSRGIVTQDVLHVLATEAAKRENITVDESILPQLVPVLTGEAAANGDPFQTLVDAAFPAIDLARDRLIMGELGRRAIGKNIVTVDGAVFTDGNKARQLAKQIAAQPDKSGELVRSAQGQAQDPLLDQQFGVLPDDVPAESVAQAVTQLVQQYGGFPFMAAPEKSVVQWRLAGEQGGYAVAYVKKHVSAPQSAQVDLSQIQPALLIAAGKMQLVSSAWQQGVKVNQRYGAWDPALLRVIPAEEVSVGSTLQIANAPNQ